MAASDGIFPEMEPGLCTNCRHHLAIRSDRGSVFHLCRLSFTDPRFPKYPRLPVIECAGFDGIAGKN